MTNSLRRVPRQLHTANQAGKQECAVDDCSWIQPALFSVNDGPAPYTMYHAGTQQIATANDMAEVYNSEMGVQGVRANEAGEAFHLPCMFPVADLGHIPDPMNESHWDWDASDEYFADILRAGVAPLLKIPVLTWQSTRLTGLAYWDSDAGRTVQKITPSLYKSCQPWPSISGVINEVGPQLALMIATRYNDPWWMANFTTYEGEGGPLDEGTYADGFNGVELMNEWMTLTCINPNPAAQFSMGSDLCENVSWNPLEDPVLYTYTEQEALYERQVEQRKTRCMGEPWKWSSRYWDGTPEDAWKFYTVAAKLLKQSNKTKNIRIGGPALGTNSPNYFQCGNYNGLARHWVEGFLNEVNSSGGRHLLDFFSFHSYDDGGNVKYAYKALRASLDDMGFDSVDLLLTEYNSAFVLSNTSSMVGSQVGAAQTAAKLAEWATHPDFRGAFIYTGRIGAFAPGDPYSFPLSCPFEWYSNKSECQNHCTPEAMAAVRPDSTPKGEPHELGADSASCSTTEVNYSGGTPDDILVPTPDGGWAEQGVWGDACSTEKLNESVIEVLGSGACKPNETTGSYPCQFGPFPQSGMGNSYTSGNLTPTGVMFSMIKSAAGSRMLPLHKAGADKLATLGNGSLAALAWVTNTSGQAKLLLTCAPPFGTGTEGPPTTSCNNTGSNMPSVVELLGPNVTQVGPSQELVQSLLGDENSEEDVIDGHNSEVPLTAQVATGDWESTNTSLDDPLPTLTPYQIVVVDVAIESCVCSLDGTHSPWTLTTTTTA